MKRIILTLTITIFTLPLFAFTEGKFVFDEELKKEILNQIIFSVNENIEVSKKAEKQEPLLLQMIREKMAETEAKILQYSKMRRNPMTSKFIDGQKNQKIAYEQMEYWDVPSQIFNYINSKFDITQINNVYINCRYTNATAIEVKFDYLGKNFTVVYSYNPNYQFGQELPIDVVENNLQK